MAILFQFGELKRDPADNNELCAEIPEGYGKESNFWMSSGEFHSLNGYTKDFLSGTFSHKKENGIFYGPIDEVFLHRLRALVNYPRFNETDYGPWPDLSPMLESAEWAVKNISDPHWVAMP